MVKAFNTAFAARQADPNVAGGLRVDGYVAGDDEAAKQTVLALLGDIGFNPVDAARWRWPATSRAWPGSTSRCR